MKNSLILAVVWLATACLMTVALTSCMELTPVKEDQTEPEPEPEPEPVLLSISSGEYHTCALRSSDGTAVCWGNGEDGQASPPADEQFTAISSGSYLIPAH